jgi:hypothetical protein
MMQHHAASYWIATYLLTDAFALRSARQRRKACHCWVSSWQIAWGFWRQSLDSKCLAIALQVHQHHYNVIVLLWFNDNMTIYFNISQSYFDILQYGNIWQHMAKYGNIWQNMPYIYICKYGVYIYDIYIYILCTLYKVYELSYNIAIIVMLNSALASPCQEGPDGERHEATMRCMACWGSKTRFRSIWGQRQQGQRGQHGINLWLIYGIYGTSHSPCAKMRYHVIDHVISLW